MRKHSHSSLVYTSGPWYAEDITPNEWLAREEPSLIFPLSTLAARRQPRKSIDVVDSGVYFLFDQDGELLYVGKSRLLADRIVSHIVDRRIPFTHVAYIVVPELFMARIEGRYISELAPPWNVR